MINLISYDPFYESKGWYNQTFVRYSVDVGGRVKTTSLILSVSPGSNGEYDPNDENFDEKLLNIIESLALSGQIKNTQITGLSQAYLDLRNEREKELAKKEKARNEAKYK